MSLPSGPSTCSRATVGSVVLSRPWIDVQTSPGGITGAVLTGVVESRQLQPGEVYRCYIETDGSAWEFDGLVKTVPQLRPGTVRILAHGAIIASSMRTTRG